MDQQNNQPAPAKNHSSVILPIIAIVLSAISLVISGLNYEKLLIPITFPQNRADGNSANFAEGSIADVANKVSSSVVSILTETTVTSYNWFFQPENTTSAAAGTGIIVSADGYILTNKHVINGATTVSVVTDDGKTYDKVQVVATDPTNDIAFLKIADVTDLPVAKLGDSKTISVGQQVIAIGNALGQYQNTVTSGIISGTGRSLTASASDGSSSEELTDMLQTDAAINAGNSGGPLVNAAGEVIGINTAVSADGENVGFAIPISSVKGMLNSLLETGKAERSYIGVYYTTITPAVASAYNLPVTAGAYVYSAANYTAVISGGPADKAGLKDKDIIVAINGTKIGNAGSVATLIGEYKPGDTVQFTVLRGGNEIAINITLGSYSSKK